MISPEVPAIMDVTVPSSLESSSFRFLDLPLELRREKYRYCLVRRGSIRIPCEFCDYFLGGFNYRKRGICDRKKSLLLISREIGFEAAEVLYCDNTFSVHLHGSGDCNLKKLFTAINIRKIRKMQLVICREGVSECCTIDSTLLSSVSSRLIKLSIVAQQPLHAKAYLDEDMFQQELKCWTKRLISTLKFVVSHVPSTCTIEVDDDGRKETGSLMREYFPNGYREVQTLEGDIHFKRNDYAQESDCSDYYDDGRDIYSDPDAWL